MKRWGYPALAFVTGAAVTVFEFAAPQMFRAFYGQTIYVWANVIGVILAALALGYLLGGRWADRSDSPLPLFGIIGAAGAYAIVVGWVGPSFALWLAGPEEYPMDASIQHFFVESLAASLVLFGPPLVALGAVSPFLVKQASRRLGVGLSAGSVFGVGTIGSLVGIYLTTFLLVDLLGVRATVSCAGALLVVVSAAGLCVTRSKRSAAAALVALAVVPFGLEPTHHELPGGTLVEAVESPYQLIRVIDKTLRDGTRQRWLAFDEGMDSFHSIDRPGEESFWTGAYYDAFARTPEWVGRKSVRICVLGNAAGTMSRLLHDHKLPDAELRIDGVELDPQVTAIARRHMGLTQEKHPHLTIFHADGRAFLRGMPKRTYDLILLDAYTRQVSIPPGLASVEFFELARSRLNEGGMLFVNLGAVRRGGNLVRALSDTMAAAFDTPVYRCPLQNQANVLLIAARGRTPPPPPPGLPFAIADRFARHVPGDLVLTDDRCPVERITAQDLIYQR
ncbi:MAG: fused MFS/spermidine synthase [Planctomycetota bacterium]